MTKTNQKFTIAAVTRLGEVALKVANLEKMSAFYQEVIGLRVIATGTQEQLLGVAGNPLLRLRKIHEALPVTNKAGLYHVAFVLPTRKALSNALRHYLQVNAPLTGASDHGYSEALYLSDPEGNGIEVYHDKPREQWDIRPGGEIIGLTEALAAEDLLSISENQWQGFTAGTRIGHVHLKVADLAASDQFYQEIIGLSLTSNFGDHAKFFAAGDYHHHLGVNDWSGSQLPLMAAHDLGIDYYTYQVPTIEEVQRMANHFSAKHTPFQTEKSGQLLVKDPNGITVIITNDLR